MTRKITSMILRGLTDKQELQASSSDRGTSPAFRLTPDEGQMIATLLKLRNWQNTINRLSTHLGITKENSGSFPLKSPLADRIRSTAGKTGHTWPETLPEVMMSMPTTLLRTLKLCPRGFKLSLVDVFQHPEDTCCYHQWSLLFLNFLCRSVGCQANTYSHQHRRLATEIL